VTLIKNKNQNKNKNKNMSEQIQIHTPVMVPEVLACLDPKQGQSYLDLTAGYGVHAASIIEATGTPSQAVLVDRDEDAHIELNARFKSQGVQLMKSDFLSALDNLVAQKRHFDMVLADLGISSPHIEKAERGFSFARAGPLDMRMDRSQKLTAEHIVNEAKEPELTQILREYGEEPKAESIAKAIISNRPITDTSHLATIIAKAKGLSGRMSKISPATKSFQAFRIAVNEELAQLEQGLPLMVEVLAPGGRLAIISFHSLEDRKVKRFFADKAGNTYDAELKLLTKKPITPSHNEIVTNPRARSAKLRAAAKIKT
jgi:16S rRNA (cytosine1402-N4)-methyltransferase